MRTLIVVASIALLAACAQGPKQVQTTAPTVTYSYSGDSELAEARNKAAEYCQKYGKAARLQTTSTSGGTNTATFDCI